MENKKIALLIDYDNFNDPKHIPLLLEDLQEKKFNIISKVAYYSLKASDKNKNEIFTKYNLEPKSVAVYGKSKNASDLILAMDAMNLMNQDFIDGICIASSDNDFAPVIHRIKSNGKIALGAGDERITEDYIKLFDDFINMAKIDKNNQNSTLNNQQNDNLSKLFIKIDQIINDLRSDSNEEYVDLSQCVQILKDNNRDFNPKNYGWKNSKTVPFFQSNLMTKHYDLKVENKVWYIKIKQNNQSPKKNENISDEITIFKTLLSKLKRKDGGVEFGSFIRELGKNSNYKNLPILKKKRKIEYFENKPFSDYFEIDKTKKNSISIRVKEDENSDKSSKKDTNSNSSEIEIYKQTILNNKTPEMNFAAFIEQIRKNHKSLSIFNKKDKKWKLFEQAPLNNYFEVNKRNSTVYIKIKK
ncbi:NYN domain-containing protein [Mycoplasmopsis gallinarum]|uniref:NYN domain-containing protein n=1 Tax=Mycoplasmopsis gallinarum TaxID=29557 RepID=A0A168R9B7_9BACT|nr:NYN domain-containing protein [Mycoplasmopsis gallinarum]OAB48746.1 hypothetical protein MGALLINA_05350 [Mycoplasmopsis gallinarum]